MKANSVIYFADAVHPEHQSRPAHGWIRKGDKVALKRNSGRKRVNIHGAVNLENFHCPVVEADRINADRTIALFEKLEAENRGKRCIHVVLDNARYHHARAVKDWMKRTKSRINLIFLPPYAPHRGAIERLWGVMHKSAYSTYKQFAEAILAFFSRTVPKEWSQFRVKWFSYYNSVEFHMTSNDFQTFMQPNETAYMDIELKRRVDKEVFRFEEATKKQGSFKRVKPSGNEAS